MIVGEWSVDALRGQLMGNGRTVPLEPRAMRLLLCLAEHPGELVSIDDLLTRVWPDVTVSSDSVYQAVASLRRQLGDDSRRPRYIATESRLGYRLVAEVSGKSLVGTTPVRGKPVGRTIAVACGLAALLVVGVAWSLGELPWGQPRPMSPTVAVLPFIDMTDTMDQEVLADDTTEGVIGAFAARPGVRTVSLRSSFQFKGRRITPAAAAAKLGVAFVVDGRVRKVGSRVNVSTQLVRGQDGLVVWSQVFEAPIDKAPALHAQIADALASRLAADTRQTPSWAARSGEPD